MSIHEENVRHIAERIMQGKLTVSLRKLRPDGSFYGYMVSELPQPQRAGTYTQQWTYAMLKAREVYDKLKSTTS